MTLETHVDHARTRVETEREALTAKRDAIDRFRERVEALATDRPQARANVAGNGGAQSLVGRSSGNGCRAVRRAFAETIRPHSLADVDDPEPLLETVRAELTDSIAVALAPNSGAGLTPTLRRAIRAEADARRRETAVTVAALGREAASLHEADETVEAITDWLVAADETPLSRCGFEALAERHERLATFRDRCGALLDDRQRFLDGTTSRDADVGVSHRSVLSFLYGDFPVEHPVLSTVVRLEATCRDCQRAVRDHLVRRV